MILGTVILFCLINIPVIINQLIKRGGGGRKDPVATSIKIFYIFLKFIRTVLKLTKLFYLRFQAAPTVMVELFLQALACSLIFCVSETTSSPFIGKSRTTLLAIIQHS